MNTPSIKLGKNIKCLRQVKKMSQGDICRKLNLDRSYVSNMETGKFNLTLAAIEKMARALGVNNGELLR
ncbi:MAG: helix-turn-helix transcriptional regulator [Candidatus Pacebacteria bacterium]|nr:helix-turn-helix transcriptional regulator [Candidatus Paceibacterota bacterium]